MGEGERLRRIGWLAGTPRAFQDAVLERCDLLQLAPGMPIYHAGDEAGGIFGVVEGRIELHLAAGDASSLAYIGGPGYWAGELAALRGHPRRFTLAARTACRLMRLPRAEIARLANDEPGRWRHFAELAASNLALAIDVVDCLRRPDPVGRVAAVLLILAREERDTGRELRVTQYDLAALTRLSRGAVNGALAALEARGWVERRYRAIALADLGALSRWAGDP
jgi:CRP-like cAMP-binding protein